MPEEGKELTVSQVAASLRAEPTPDPLPRAPRSKVLNGPTIIFCRYVARGCRIADSYREAFGKHGMTIQVAGATASRLLRKPEVMAYIDELRAKTEASTLLTINDRLGILSDIATNPLAKNVEKIAAVRVYHEIAGSSNGVPMPASTTAEVEPRNVTPSRSMTMAEKIEAIRARRAGRPSLMALPAA